MAIVSRSADLQIFSSPSIHHDGEQRDVERRLRAAEHRFEVLFTSAPDAYLVTDENGVIERANPAAALLFGKPAKLLEASMVGAFADGAACSDLPARLGAVPDGGHLDPWTLQLRVEEGRTIPVEISIAPLEYREDGKRAFVWLLHDLSARREAEESMHALNRVLNARVAQRTRELELALEGEQAARREAEAANRIKSELFARLSHEFRTPLHAVSGYLEILQQNIHGGLTLDQRRDIERIHQAQEHLLALVNMILDFAKIEGGPVELSMAEIPVEETLRSAQGLVAPQLAKKGVAYTHRSGNPSVTVFADREKVQQIVVNLLANAMKFTHPGGSVGLEWTVEDETLLVRIRDTGLGIPSDMTEQIFEPFVQLRSPGSPPSGGTGLGLPISRDLARAMGGDVRVTSTVGVGSVFTLLLPLRKHAGTAKLSA
ncbi:MAG TPA: ATP-binding protein [Gemmatimonadaceae bacterium]|nr:ATP-binding protein [Gemmatimonadaceae bacterium]